MRGIEEGDSDAWKGSVQTRHTQTAFSSLDRKNYRQERTYKYRPDDSRFSRLLRLFLIEFLQMDILSDIMID